MQTLTPMKMERPAEGAGAPVSRRQGGLAVGVFLALWHAAWSAVVAAGLGQKLIDFVLWLHFLTVPIQVQPFGAARALGLIAFTFAVGYGLGWAFVAVWEAYRRRAA